MRHRHPVIGRQITVRLIYLLAGGRYDDEFIAVRLSGNLPPADPLQADQQYDQLIFDANISRRYDPSRTDLLRDMGVASFAANRDLTRSSWGGNSDGQLAQLAFPVLVIYGKADNSPFTGEAVAQQLAGVLPNATLTAMERSGHWPYLEEPKQFQTVISGFWQNECC